MEREFNKSQMETNGNGNDIISTKANTLKALSTRITNGKIEEMNIIIVKDFFADKTGVAEQIKEQFRGNKIVVRSSSTNEDCFKKSNAGHYTSVLDVDSSKINEIIAAIDTVADSYASDMERIDDEQVLVQHQAEKVVYSGVLFTHDIQGKRPYYLINYDDKGSTDSVTSGRGGKTLWIARNIDIAELEITWRNLLVSVQEIEKLLNDIPLDIEFAIDESNEVIIFQVRPLVAVSSGPDRIDDLGFFKKLDTLKEQYKSYVNILDGKNMMFSDMAFWNPSEIIGTTPRPLDYSLYRSIITNRAWNEGIAPMGYRKLEDDLMFQIGNKPYISLEYSFYSLIPEKIPENLALKLVDYYSQKLKSDITAHDKIEFEILFTTFDFGTKKYINNLLEYGFTKEEVDLISEKLYELTLNNVIEHKKISDRDTGDINRLELIREDIEAEDYENMALDEILSNICKLLEGIKNYGTPQFARQARMAFMARAFCQTLESEGWFSSEEIDVFMKSIETVSSKFEADYQLFSKGKLSRKDFNKKYGHLRSGTYDIRTDRYDQMVFRPVAAKNVTKEKKYMKGLNEAQLSRALESIGFDVSTEEFNNFLVSAIEGREFFKFQFTKSLSLVLELIRAVGKMLEIKRKDLSWLRIEDFEKANSLVNDIRNSKDYGKDAELFDFIIYIKEKWMKQIHQRKNSYRDISDVILPDVILDAQGVQVIPVNEARPNFITSKKVEGEVVRLEEETDEDLMDKIVVIPKADPGYEWIFTKGIKGFITKYGGVASHMAIRCAEFEIPAAIGCGEKIYDYVSGRSYIELDCANGKIGEGMQCQDLRAIITQREGVNVYGDSTDVLESAYIRFYEVLGFIPQPASNHIKNVGKLFERQCDLLIVVGGGALPCHYYDRPHDEELQVHRDIMEERLIMHCLEQGIPIIATCRGMQYMNVLFGGKLLYHPELKVDRPRGEDHKVYLTKEDRYIWVNNFHKDVIPVEGLAECFEPLAIDTENNTIEAYGSDEMKVLALQWHPERKFETSNALQETRKLVVNFIQKHIQ